MEDYIFLILAVVLSIYTAITKKKKKSEDLVPETEEDEQSHNFLMDQLLGDDFLSDFEAKPKVYKEAEIIREPLIAKPMSSQLAGYQSKFTSNLPSRKSSVSIRSRKADDDNINTQITESEKKETIVADFTLRKAFVYSEIMNPKYIISENKNLW